MVKIRYSLMWVTIHDPLTYSLEHLLTSDAFKIYGLLLGNYHPQKFSVIFEL